MIDKLQTLKKHQGFIRYFKNTSWMMIEQFLRIVTGLFVGIWIVRVLGPEQFGVLSLLIALTAIFSSVSKLGLDAILTKDFIDAKEHTQTLSNAFYLSCLGVLLFLVCIYIYSSFFLESPEGHEKIGLMLIIMALSYLTQPFGVIEYYFQAKVKMKIISIYKIVLNIIFSTTKLVLLMLTGDVFVFVAIISLEVFFLYLFNYIAYTRTFGSLNLEYPDFNKMFNLLKISWPYMLTSLAVIIYMKIDQVIIEDVLGIHELGIYSAALKIIEPFYAIPMIIAASLFPALLNVRSKDDVYCKRLSILYGFIFWIAVIVSIIIFFISGNLISLLYGDDYADARSVLDIYIWLSILVFIGVINGKWYVSEGLEKLFLLNTLVGLIVNVILNYFFIEKYGLIGAVYASVAAYTTSILIMNLVWKRTRVNFFLMIKGIVFVFKLNDINKENV
ncbi:MULTISPECIES: flippase [unclassified Marinobacterium]|uniref:flippase n=1 Tax=unclassified Marinobacterium TaxID=2644139 RepID=UPI00156A7321|nr:MULTISPECIES: flippase [unclassified Marinobacterium]NRP56640.1 Polysaccharide biosynthesis protein [Marinobacterium sp. xm-d-510]NRP96571.1 Polysaccharide biosynthesis protein [Marinobacterium sp. xm-a-127]